jgi:hypothetical protein
MQRDKIEGVPAAISVGDAMPQTKPVQPPDERFWKRHSPHHEFPLSTTSAIVAHAVVFALVIGYLALQKLRSEEAKPLSVGAVVIAGGGGSPDGEEGANPRRNEDVGQENKVDPPNPVEPKEALKNVSSVDPVKLPEFQGPDGRLLDDANDSVRRLANQSEDLRKTLFKGIAEPKPKGQGGTGSGGGKGKGKGTGEGDLEGPGKGNITVRQRRVLRWTMIFNTTDGRDYAQQLAALEAILAVPASADPNEQRYIVYRDLKHRPVTGKIEDLSDIKRIFWVDDTPQSVGPLALGLGLPPPPPSKIVAFFPEWLEAKLLKIEHDYRGLAEHEIKETRFRVVRSGRGYVLMVIDQR